VFGTVTEWTHFYNKVFYSVIWCFNGLIQSTGWPSVVAVMGNWFGKSGRGLVFGIWSSCASVGNIIGAVLTASVIDYGYEVKKSVAPNSIVMDYFVVTFHCFSNTMRRFRFVKRVVFCHSKHS